MLRVFVTTGRPETRVTGYDRWRKAWAVDVAAVPERGAANRELLRYLAGRLRVPAARLRLLGGERARLKSVSSTLSEEELAERLGP